MVQRESTPWVFITRLQQKDTLALLAANVPGAIVYVAAASRSRAVPEERESWIHSITGEPFVWAQSVWPILTVFLLLNLGWAAVILAKRRWQDGRLWFTAPLIWLVCNLS